MIWSLSISIVSSSVVNLDSPVCVLFAKGGGVVECEDAVEGEDGREDCAVLDAKDSKRNETSA